MSSPPPDATPPRSPPRGREPADRGTRRDWLGLAALVAGAAGCLDLPASDDGGSDAAGDADATTLPEAGSDANDAAMDTGPDPADAPTLNALLAAEYNTIAAYTAGAGILSAPPMGDPLAALAPVLLQIASRWLAHHQDHANALRDAVTALGATPVDPTTGAFTPPAGFTASVANVLKLACNAEKSLALAHNHAAGTLATADARYLAAVIQGDETQHFAVLYVILNGTAAPGPMLSTHVDAVVPTSFVVGVGTSPGLESVPDLAIGAG